MSLAINYARDLVADADDDGGGYDFSEAVDALRNLIHAYDRMRKDLEAMRNGSIASAREPSLVVTVNVTAPLCDPEQLSQTIKQALDPELRRLTAHKQAIPTVYPVQ